MSRDFKKNFKEKDIKTLTKILSKLQNLYYKKKDQLHELENEISSLKTTLDDLNSIISSRSFHSADELYLEKSQGSKEISEEHYFVENLPEESVSGTKIKRKIFLKKKEDEELICILNLIDMDELEIKMLQPNKYKIEETSDRFIKIFIKEALIEIKERNPNLKLNYEHIKDTNIIEKIIIKNLNSINDFDLITEKLRKFFSSFRN